jgi:hypothetical protein
VNYDRASVSAMNTYIRITGVCAGTRMRTHLQADADADVDADIPMCRRRDRCQHIHVHAGISGRAGRLMRTLKGSTVSGGGSSYLISGCGCMAYQTP